MDYPIEMNEKVGWGPVSVVSSNHARPRDYSCAALCFCDTTRPHVRQVRNSTAMEDDVALREMYPPFLSWLPRCQGSSKNINNNKYVACKAVVLLHEKGGS